MFVRRAAIAAVLAVQCGVWSAAAQAGTTTPLAVNVTSRVVSTCQVSATKTDVAFGSIPAFLSGTVSAHGGIRLTCNKGATVNLSVDNGQSFALGQVSTLRAMKSGSANFMSYHVFRPTGATFIACGGTTNWTTPLNVSSLWSAAGGQHEVWLCGRVDAAPAAGYAAGATYADVVSVQATF